MLRIEIDDAEAVEPVAGQGNEDQKIGDIPEPGENGHGMEVRLIRRKRWVISLRRASLVPEPSCKVK
jgi:hypothetical protein